VRTREVRARLHIVDHAIVHASDQALAERDAGKMRKKRLRDRVRHVDGTRVAPLRHDVAVPEDDAVCRRARSERTDGIRERLPREIERDRDAQVAHIGDLGELGREFRLVGDGEVDRRLELPGIEAFSRGRMRRPAGTWGRHVIRRTHRRGKRH